MNKRNRGTAATDAASREQLQTLLREHEPRARRVALSLTKNEAAADELLQDAAYRVLRSWKRYDPLKSFAGWYLTIIRNLFLNAQRDGQRTVSLLKPVDSDGQQLIDMLVDAQANVWDELERGELREVLSNAVGTLSTKYRAVVQVCYFEGASYREAAQRLGIPIGTVRSRLSRARATLGRDPAVRRLA